MLRNLLIENFAIIDRVALDLDRGLNVMTGETGAGKSILIDAVSSILGTRFGAEIVRTGAEQAFVEGLFDVEAGSAVEHYLRDQDLDSGEGTVIISRTIYRSGRGVSRVNGRAAPLATLQELGHRLTDVHGQSEHLSLLRVAEHIDYLDGYAGLKGERQEMLRLVSEVRSIRREIAALQQDEREAARRADLLRFQIDEIAAASLAASGVGASDEEEDLRRERTRLANAEKLSQSSGSAYRLLYEGDDDSRSALDTLGDLASELSELGRIDSDAARFGQTLEEARLQLDDLSRDLRAYRDEIEFNPARLEEVEDRLDLIRNLKRKYGGSISEILDFAEQAAKELDGIAHRDERLHALREKERQSLVAAGELAEKLSSSRREAAAGLQMAVEKELAELAMGRSAFCVQFDRVDDETGIPASDGRKYRFDATGFDRVEFFISTNPGEPPKPLARVASGGETSRLMLALKGILAAVDVVPVLIFDEIDVGVGGRSGYTVGQKLSLLARERQVICVTHLPQIAAFGDRHLRIAKRVEGDRTTTSVDVLSDDARADEIAIMLGGVEGSAEALANARDLLTRATKWKAGNRTSEGRA